jgi:hypothetical protein
MAHATIQHMRARRMGIIKEDSIMELGRVVFSLFICDKVVCILPWPEDCLRKFSRALAPPGVLSPFLVNPPELRQWQPSPRP